MSPNEGALAFIQRSEPVTCTPGEVTESHRSGGGRSSVSSWEVRHIFHYWASWDFTASLKTVYTSQKVLYLRWEMVCNGVWKILPNDKQSGLQEIRGRRLVACALKHRLMWLSVDQYVQTMLSVLHISRNDVCYHLQIPIKPLIMLILWFADPSNR